MKKTLSAVALLLAVLMIAMCCVACGDDKKDEETQAPTAAATLPALPTPSDATPTAAPVDNTPAGIVGSWKTSIDFAKLMESMLASTSGVDQSSVDLMLKLYQGINLTMVMEFKSDNTFTAAADQASVNAALEQLKANIKNNLTDILAMYGMTEADLAANGYTVDSFVDYMFTQVDTSEMQQTSTGVYRLDGNKLYTADSAAEIKDDQYLVVDITSATLTITEVVAPDADEASMGMLSSAMLPMVFTKA